VPTTYVEVFTDANEMSDRLSTNDLDEDSIEVSRALVGEVEGSASAICPKARDLRIAFRPARFSYVGRVRECDA
jgi:hypothetical protein